MSGTFFGDFDVEDALDTEPADPEQVARRLHRITRQLEQLAGRDQPSYDDLPDHDRRILEWLGQQIVHYVDRHDPINEEFAHAVHDFARHRRGEGPRWDDLDAAHREVSLDISMLILTWLVRQGAWR